MGILCLLVFACKPGLNDKQRDQVTDIASDAAPDYDDKISALESRIDELESRLGY